MNLESRYCATQNCPQGRWFDHSESYCSTCRAELTPCILCLCGEGEYNPKDSMPACLGCGTRWTPDSLAVCMSAQLKGLVSQITEKFSTLP